MVFVCRSSLTSTSTSTTWRIVWFHRGGGEVGEDKGKGGEGRWMVDVRGCVREGEGCVGGWVGGEERGGDEERQSARDETSTVA